MPLRSLLPVALVLLLAGEGVAQQPASDRALRDWGHSIGVLGYVYGAPLLELAIAEYRQTHGLARDMSGPRGVIAHGMGGRLPTHETTWLATPNPDVLHSSAWLDVEQQPYVLFIPPMDGHWYSVQFEDSFTNDVAYLSSRTIGSVGGWYLIAHESWAGERPPGLMEDEVRIPTPIAWLLLRIAATPENEASFHERYQARFKLLPLEIYQRNPKAAALASSQPQASPKPPVRASNESRGTLEAFRVIQHRLRQLSPRPEEAALLALFDRAGFGPNVEFEPTQLAGPLLDGLRSAAREAHKLIHELGLQPQPRNGWSAAPTTVGSYGDDYLLRARSAAGGIGASLPIEIASLEASTDRDGRLLDGRNDYRIRFEPSALPPSDAFWSIAAYAAETRRLLDTHTGRHSIGSSTQGLARDPSGALEIYLSSAAPDDPTRRANWLPVRAGPLLLVARIYQPLPALLEGRYSMPPVVPADD